MDATVTHLNIEVSNRCNQGCFYCFNESGPTGERSSMALSDLVSVIGILSARGLKSVHITGGEPFMWPETIDLLKAIDTVGVGFPGIRPMPMTPQQPRIAPKPSNNPSPGETTTPSPFPAVRPQEEKSPRRTGLSNGFRVKCLAEEHYDVLAGMDLMQISLDAMNPELHNARRGYGKAFDDATSAIATFREMGVPVEISSVISDENLNELPALGAYANDMGAAIILRPMVPFGRGEGKLLSSDFLSRFNRLRAEMMDSGVRVVEDRFRYVPASRFHDKDNRQHGIMTLEHNGHFRGTELKINNSGPISTIEELLAVAV